MEHTAAPPPAAPLVLITGSSGRIGRRLAEVLAPDYTVVGLDLNPEEFRDRFDDVFAYDATDRDQLQQALRRVREQYGTRVASVIHLAAYYNFDGQEHDLYDEVTVKGTRKLLRELREQDFQVEQFVFSSTNLVYEPVAPGELIQEGDSLDPAWAYPASKVRTERVIREERGDIPAVIARIAGAYDDWGHSIPLAHQIQRIYEKRLLGHLYSGDTEKGNPFVHFADVCSALRQMIDHRHELEPYEVLNIGEGKTYSYGTLQDRIGELIHGEEWTTLAVPPPLAKAGATVQDTFGDPFIKPWMIDRADDHYQLDISAAKQKIGWEPEHDVYRDLEPMIANLKRDPKQWYRENDLQPLETEVVAHDIAPPTTDTSEDLHLRDHQNYSWVLYVNMVIGLWMISDPFTFAYGDAITTYATIGSGVALIFLSFLALHPYRLWAKWGINFVAFGLYLIPMVFYSETAGAFSLLYVVATLLIGLNLLVPSTPGIHLVRTPGPVDPPGWSYNPSAWEERIPVITIAWVGFLVARYMASYQLDYIGHISDPAFGEGTMRVLDSEVSESFPVSDAALGAVSYLLDVLMGYLGSTARWRTMPWVVIIFAILIIPLGVVSITLVILQPVAVGYWCFFCLITASISVLMMPFTFDEAAASAEFLIRAKREGQSFWKVFWKGGTLKDWPEEDYPAYRQDRLLHSTAKQLFSEAGNIPWNLLVCAAIGVGIMTLPGLLGYAETSLAKSDIIVGALAVTCSIATISEVARAGRLFNVLLGGWLAVSVFVFSVPAEGYQWVHWVAALALIGLAIPRGPVVERHGMFDRYII